MRIITGLYKKRILQAPPGASIRPTSDKVKGALFNMLGPLEGARVLDLFAGTGNLGLEALSRGAREVVFVDSSPSALRWIQKNLLLLGLSEEGEEPRVEVSGQEDSAALRRLYRAGREFDILLADPPYGPGALRSVQARVAAWPVLAPGGLLVVEHGAKDVVMDPAFPWPLRRQRRYGDTLLSMFQRPVKGSGVGEAP